MLTPAIPKLPVAPYSNTIPINMIPVVKEPIRKYFNEASLLFKFFLSEPVKMYNGIERISIPRNNISIPLNEVRMAVPHSTKKINA